MCARTSCRATGFRHSWRGLPRSGRRPARSSRARPSIANMSSIEQRSPKYPAFGPVLDHPAWRGLIALCRCAARLIRSIYRAESVSCNTGAGDRDPQTQPACGYVPPDGQGLAVPDRCRPRMKVRSATFAGVAPADRRSGSHWERRDEPGCAASSADPRDSRRVVPRRCWKRRSPRSTCPNRRTYSRYRPTRWWSPIRSGFTRGDRASVHHNASRSSPMAGAARLHGQSTGSSAITLDSARVADRDGYGVSPAVGRSGEGVTAFDPPRG